jgi:trehalose 6-phosphate synthase
MSVNGDNPGERLIVASNRLPVTLNRDADGGWEAQPASGGLVHALKYVLQERGGRWFGWSGVAGDDGVSDALKSAAAGLSYEMRAIPLTEDQVEKYYFGFSNEVLWPLFHDMVSRCQFVAAYWQSYEAVNRLFAEELASGTDDHDFIWVQDYHLIRVAYHLRRMRRRRRTGYFLHIPFPPVDVFVKLPWRFEILEGLLAYDTLGFQTVRDTINFVSCVRQLLTGVTVRAVDDIYVASAEGHGTQIGNFPIGIDFKEFDRRARLDSVSAEVALLHQRLPDRQIILGIDRLDYTKGIPERLHAYRDALHRYPQLIETTSMLQVVVPSREIVGGYRSMKEEVEQLVSEINGEFTRPGWVPVHYLFRSLSMTELVAFYRASEISLVTPIKDGMNLISKEYVAANVDLNGTLILSEFAGSAAQLSEYAILVNPHDVVGTADAILRAFEMHHGERELRMTGMRRIVADTDVFWWTNAFLALALDGNARLDPPQHYYVPRRNVTEDAPSSDVMLAPEAWIE